ncbi:MAG TPA: 2-amino-4-hydroxy-6-hydroxymethyldihydropteridine diphosphokinase [Pyrinomonadaceae bacterium]|nr:2-amino-4-hydroxy-6-hydroxymethyldihydropteridine diphosphokinase [Pyrinomonadaceae bacterium]
MPSAYTHAYVGLGSNLGDRAGHLLLAVRGMLEAGLTVARLSSVYETEPVGTPGAQPLYLNMVAELALDAHDDEAAPPPSPEQLLARLLRIEYLLGRRRDAALAPRTIDLDLLLYGDALAETPYLTLPHPRLHLRRFVLTPLAELAPDGVHPTLGVSFKTLLFGLSDDSKVERWTPAGVYGEPSETEIFN